MADPNAVRDRRIRRLYEQGKPLGEIAAQVVTGFAPVKAVTAALPEDSHAARRAAGGNIEQNAEGVPHPQIPTPSVAGEVPPPVASPAASPTADAVAPARCAVHAVPEASASDVLDVSSLDSAGAGGASPAPATLSAEEREKIIRRMWGEGVEIKVIAATVGLSRGRISQLASLLRLTPRPTSGRGGAKDVDIRRLWMEGKTAAEIAPLVGRSISGVRMAAERMGLPTWPATNTNTKTRAQPGAVPAVATPGTAQPKGGAHAGCSLASRAADLAADAAGHAAPAPGAVFARAASAALRADHDHPRAAGARQGDDQTAGMTSDRGGNSAPAPVVSADPALAAYGITDADVRAGAALNAAILRRMGVDQQPWGCAWSGCDARTAIDGEGRRRMFCDAHEAPAHDAPRSRRIKPAYSGNATRQPSTLSKSSALSLVL